MPGVRLHGRVRRRDVPVAFALGVVLALAALAYLWLHPRKVDLLVVLTAEIVGGREVSIPAGLALGFGWTQLALVVTMIELTSLFLLFPLLVGLAAGLHKVRWLEGALARAQDYARRNPDVDILVLGGLTLMPFLPIGALTSVLVGEMLRLPSRYLLPTLAAALVVANVSLAWAADRLLAYVPHPELVAALMAGLLLLGGGVAYVVHRRRR